MKFNSRISLLLLSACIFVLSACTTPATPTADASEPQVPATEAVSAPVESSGLDACALLTKADAESILGQVVQDPQRPIQGSATFDVSSCKYQVEGEAASENVTLIVTVPVNGDAQSAQTAFETDKAASSEMLGAAPVDVPGVGDSAYWVAGYGNQLSILKGNTHLILSATNQTGDSAPQAVIDLAVVILSRLP
jgi:hypothetical protein